MERRRVNYHNHIRTIELVEEGVIDYMIIPLDDCREPVFNTPEHQNLYAEVMALPAKYRLPLYLYYYEGYTAAEVGELLGLGPSTVRTRLARAREKLKAQLREE